MQDCVKTSSLDSSVPLSPPTVALITFTPPMQEKILISDSPHKLFSIKKDTLWMNLNHCLTMTQMLLRCSIITPIVMLLLTLWLLVSFTEFLNKHFEDNTLSSLRAPLNMNSLPHNLSSLHYLKSQFVLSILIPKNE